MNKTIFITVFLFTLSITLLSQDLEINWQQCFGGSEGEGANDILKKENEYFVVGGTASDDGDITFNHGHSDGWLISIDSIGNIVWEKTYGGSDGDFWKRILSAPENYYYLIGNSMSSDGDISYDPYPGSNDIWVIKIDSTGSILWDKIIGGGMIDAIESATLTQDGGVAVFGWTGSQNGDVSVNYGYYDMWLVKLNSDGEIVWERSYGTDDFDYGQAMIATSDGGFLIGGASTIGNGGNLTCEPYNYNAEAILLKLDSLGNIEWQNCYGGSGHDGIWGMIELEDGYAFVGYGSSNDGDLTGSGWHGEGDIWVAKLDFYGNLVWQKCYGGSSMESAKNILNNENNGLVIWGSTRSQNGDITNNHSISEYDYDIWYFKLDSIGELISQSCYGGGGNDFLDFGVVQKGDNNYVIAAYTDFGPSYDVACAPHGGYGDEDWWVFEIKDTTTGIFDTPAKQDNVKVYPSPAGEYVVFEFEVRGSKFEVEKTNREIQILNVFGKEITSLQVNAEKTVWDTRQVQNGVYFYRLEMAGKMYGGKIVVQK
jgi:hypothetical protein